MALDLTTFASNATIGATERSIPSDTTTGVPVSRTEDGVYQLVLDVSAIAAGDQFRIQVYEAVNGGTQRVAGPPWILDGPVSPVQIFDIGMLGDAWDVTLKKLAGTDRAIRWSLRRVS
jgi:hypothetical protein